MGFAMLRGDDRTPHQVITTQPSKVTGLQARPNLPGLFICNFALNWSAVVEVCCTNLKLPGSDPPTQLTGTKAPAYTAIILFSVEMGSYYVRRCELQLPDSHQYSRVFTTLGLF